MLLEINLENIDNRKISQVIEVLKKGGLVIIPTDTIYAACCSMQSKKGFQRLCEFKNIAPAKASFSMLLSDLSSISHYTKQFDRNIFRILKKALPGPYTFILPCSQAVCEVFSSAKKTIGVRVPENDFVQLLIKELDSPLLAASLHDEDEIIKYSTDPSTIYEQFDEKVDLIVDGGYGKNTGSTVVDCSDGSPLVLRQGLGGIDILD